MYGSLQDVFISSYNVHYYFAASNSFEKVVICRLHHQNKRLALGALAPARPVCIRIYYGREPAILIKMRVCAIRCARGQGRTRLLRRCEVIARARNLCRAVYGRSEQRSGRRVWKGRAIVGVIREDAARWLVATTASGAGNGNAIVQHSQGAGTSRRESPRSILQDFSAQIAWKIDTWSS